MIKMSIIWTDVHKAVQQKKIMYAQVSHQYVKLVVEMHSTTLQKNVMTITQFQVMDVMIASLITDLTALIMTKIFQSVSLDVKKDMR